MDTRLKIPQTLIASLMNPQQDLNSSSRNNMLSTVNIFFRRSMKSDTPQYLFEDCNMENYKPHSIPFLFTIYILQNKRRIIALPSTVNIDVLPCTNISLTRLYKLNLQCVLHAKWFFSFSVVFLSVNNHCNMTNQ